MSKAIINVINKATIEFTSDKNTDFIPEVKKLGARWHGKKRHWTLDYKKFALLVVLANGHFDNVDVKNTTKDVLDKKFETRRKIVLGAKVLSHLDRLTTIYADDLSIEDYHFMELIESMIGDMEPKEKILFNHNEQALIASRRERPEENFIEVANDIDAEITMVDATTVEIRTPALVETEVTREERKPTHKNSGLTKGRDTVLKSWSDQIDLEDKAEVSENNIINEWRSLSRT